MVLMLQLLAAHVRWIVVAGRSDGTKKDSSQHLADLEWYGALIEGSLMYVMANTSPVVAVAYKSI